MSGYHGLTAEQCARIDERVSHLPPLTPEQVEGVAVVLADIRKRRAREVAAARSQTPGRRLPEEPPTHLEKEPASVEEGGPADVQHAPALG